MIIPVFLLVFSSVLAYQTDGRCARRAFIKSGAAAASTIAALSKPTPSLAFDGGVGGLGKTKPETGIVFRNTDLNTDASSAAGTADDLTNELLAPDGSPVIVSFDAPWPVLKSSTGVESRDLQNPEAAFLQVAEAPRGAKAAELKKEFFFETVFGSKGKYGAYGQPIDIKVKRVSDYSREGYGLYTASFTTFTPGSRESERMIYITTAIVGNGVFMLISGSTAPRFRKQQASLRKIAESFSCVAAPKSSLRSSS